MITLPAQRPGYIHNLQLLGKSAWRLTSNTWNPCPKVFRYVWCTAALARIGRSVQAAVRCYRIISWRSLPVSLAHAGLFRCYRNTGSPPPR